MNKLIPKSPLGIIVTAAAVVLTISPEARKFTRRMAVKGIAGVMSAVDQMKLTGTAVQHQVKGLVEEAKQPASATPGYAEPTPVYDTEIEPVPFITEEHNHSQTFNVLNDDYVKKQYLEFEKQLH